MTNFFVSIINTRLMARDDGTPSTAVIAKHVTEGLSKKKLLSCCGYLFINWQITADTSG